MRTHRTSGSTQRRISIATARKLAREVKATRRAAVPKFNAKELAKLLGHFGPPVRSKQKKRSVVRKSSKKRAA